MSEMLTKEYDNPMCRQAMSLPELIRSQYEDLEVKTRKVLSFQEIFNIQRVVLTGCGDSYAAVVLSFGGLGLFMCGRFAGSWIMQRIRAERVLLYCALGTVAATFLIVCNLGKISLVALFLVYVFEAIMFPTIFAISLKGLGNKTKRASSFLMMSPVGGAIGPVLMGYVADNSNMSLSFIIPFVSFCVVLFYSWYADVEGN